MNMRFLLWLMAGVVMLAPALQTANARPTNDAQGTNVEKVKIQVAKLGVGDKARATVTTKSGAKVKGYIYSAGDEEFVMRDRKTDAPTTVRYADVAKVDGNRGHSVMRNVLIAVGIGSAVVLTSVYLAIRRNER
jgi:preprotein translocase subunit SecF